MPKKILAVDDERHIVRLVQVNLQRAGYEVVTVSSLIDPRSTASGMVLAHSVR